MCGQTVKRTSESGSRTKCMATENSNGRTASSILGRLQTISAKAKALLPGGMAVFTKGTGEMGSSMARVCLSKRMARRELAFGKTAGTLNG